MLRSRTALVLLLTGIAASVFISGAVLMRSVDINSYRGEIIKILTKLSGHPVNLELVSYAPSSGLLSARLENLEILSNNPDDPPLLIVPQALVGLGLSSLIFSEKDRPWLDISSLTLVNPQINLVKHTGEHLWKRAQKGAMASDKNLELILGKGFAKLTIDNIAIREGILTILDWEHKEGQTLILDHFQLKVQHLSPTKASPLSASARFQLMPFTMSGHVGPLPSNLNLFEMPIRLSIEAKSLETTQLFKTFSNLPLEAQASSSYFSALLDGTLDKGLKITSWLKLGKLAPRGSNQIHHNEKPLPIALLTEHTDNDQPQPIDISFRQKSKLILGSERLSFSFNEFFIYLDGAPLFDIKGTIVHDETSNIELNIRALDTLNLDRIPLITIDYPWISNKIGGQIGLSGKWPEGLRLESQLDLTHTHLTWPGVLEKLPGDPLRIRANALLSPNHIQLLDADIHRPAGGLSLGDNRLFDNDVTYHLMMSGSLMPTIDLRINGRWDLDDIIQYLPFDTKSWDLSGELDVAMNWKQSNYDDPPQFFGSIGVSSGQVGPYPFEKVQADIRIERTRLMFPKLEIGFVGGVIQGSFWTDWQSQPIYEAFLSFGGISWQEVSALSKETSFLNTLNILTENNPHPIRLRGTLSGESFLQGVLTPEFMPNPPEFVQGVIRLDNAILLGLGVDTFIQPLRQELVIKTDLNNSIPWNHATTHYTYNNLDTLHFKNIRVESPGIIISGEGIHTHDGVHQFDLDVDVAAWQSGTSHQIRLIGNRNELTLIPVSENISVAPDTEGQQ
ncbi:MAG: hypothetical protein HQL54_11045 [Magnetococcales bacterium]|nr:hypothetical protein [Magnetococcales bacterium]